MTCSSIVGRQSGLPTDGLSLGLQGRLLVFSFFPVALCFASSIWHNFFCNVWPQLSLFWSSLFFTIPFQVWHWHPHRSSRDFRLECSHLWPQALVFLSHWHSQGLVIADNNVYTLSSFHKITSSFILSLWSAGPDHCQECWGRKTGEATHSKQAFLLCFSFELKLHTSVSLKNGLKSFWS